MVNRKYSVFIFNVASCTDRYCSAYGREFSMDEMFDRVASIPIISAVDLVLTPDFIVQKEKLKENLARTGLKVACVMADTVANQIYKQGSYSSLDKIIRNQAISESKQAIDFAAEVGCNTFCTWPGQDGYDYIFQADYIKEHQLFSEAIAELCDYQKDIDITLEYKVKEPRTHSYISNVSTTLLMIQEIGAKNLGIAMDFGHALLGYESPAESAAMCSMYGDRLKHVHINDNYRLWDDDMIVGSIHTLEYLEFIYWLRRTKYKGYITFDQYPYREDGREAVNESALWMDYLESLIDKADIDEIAAVLLKKDAAQSSRLMRKLIKG